MQIPASFHQGLSRGLPDILTIGIVKDAAGKYNPITLSWVMQTSWAPPLLVTSIAPSRHSFDAMRRSREFVIALPSESQIEATVLFGTASGRDMDKLERSGLATQPATKIDCVLLSDAIVNHECKLVDEFETGDHSIFVGEVVATHVNKDPAVRRIYAFAYTDYAAVKRDD
jgi:flavin reductase (DIM6/NTAB) family NADH-FMN oxidoreductase RutF